MTPEDVLKAAIREAWASIPPPPLEDLKYMAWGWGEEAYRTFAGVAPMDVDISSVGFYSALPLLDLSPRFGAAYLGTYLLSLLCSLETQRSLGISSDIETRAHTLTCLELPWFWERVVQRFLPLRCREVLVQVVDFLVSEPDALALTPQQTEAMVTLAAQSVNAKA